MTDGSRESEQWLARAHAVGRAQARQFWLLLLAGVFFFSLRQSEPSTRHVSVPVFDLQLDHDAVLAVGPAILSLLAMAAIGSMAAWGDALKHYGGEDWSAQADRLDLAPTPVDFILIAVRGWPVNLGDFVKLVMYPCFLSLVGLEAALEYLWLLFADARARVPLLVVEGPMVLGALLLIVGVWRFRLTEFKKQWVARKLTAAGADGRAAEAAAGSPPH